MRLNKFVASATGLSRRKADDAIKQGLVALNGKQGNLGDKVASPDTVKLNGKVISLPARTTILLSKPAGYVCSREGQGSKTIYELLPKKWHHLKTIGRLDKDSSGLLLLTNDGDLSNKLSHPRYQKEKIYEVQLSMKISSSDIRKLEEGVNLEDGMSRFINLRPLSNNTYEVMITEGRNRQIRRTFKALCYEVISLHRIQLGPYELPSQLEPGGWKLLDEEIKADESR
jgi:23S rRNA pseudouridine2605 synthase